MLVLSNLNSFCLQATNRQKICSSKVRGTASQTDILGTYIASLEDELLRRNEELYRLREDVEELQFDEGAFADDQKVSFYTGLPNLGTLKVLQEHIDPDLSNVREQKMSNFQKLLLCLMKLRCDYPFQDLAYRFRIKPSNASLIFKEVALILSNFDSNGESILTQFFIEGKSLPCS